MNFHRKHGNDFIIFEQCAVADPEVLSNTDALPRGLLTAAIVILAVAGLASIGTIVFLITVYKP